jgi:peptidoglycan L-alanyl-D-glutamate endopeptidase CwlK
MVDNVVIVDSEMDFAGAVAGTEAPREVIGRLCLIDVRYMGFDDRLHLGQILAHRNLEMELREIFSLMEKIKFPVASAVPIVRYEWSDEASMAADNTSAFNYRHIAGTDRFSCHATGRAVDINPLRNPVIYQDGRVVPAGALYRPDVRGTLVDGDFVVRAFTERGWRWGGHFGHMRDYHHFEK